MMNLAFDTDPVRLLQLLKHAEITDGPLVDADYKRSSGMPVCIPPHWDAYHHCAEAEEDDHAQTTADNAEAWWETMRSSLDVGGILLVGGIPMPGESMIEIERGEYRHYAVFMQQTVGLCIIQVPFNDNESANSNRNVHKPVQLIRQLFQLFCQSENIGEECDDLLWNETYAGTAILLPEYGENEMATSVGCKKHRVFGNIDDLIEHIHALAKSKCTKHDNLIYQKFARYLKTLWLQQGKVDIATVKHLAKIGCQQMLESFDAAVTIRDGDNIMLTLQNPNFVRLHKTDPDRFIFYKSIAVSGGRIISNVFVQVNALTYQPNITDYSLVLSMEAETDPKCIELQRRLTKRLQDADHKLSLQCGREIIGTFGSTSILVNNADPQTVFDILQQSNFFLHFLNKAALLDCFKSTSLSLSTAMNSTVRKIVLKNLAIMANNRLRQADSFTVLREPADFDAYQLQIYAGKPVKTLPLPAETFRSLTLILSTILTLYTNDAHPQKLQAVVEYFLQALEDANRLGHLVDVNIHCQNFITTAMPRVEILLDLFAQAIDRIQQSALELFRDDDDYEQHLPFIHGLRGISAFFRIFESDFMRGSAAQINAWKRFISTVRLRFVEDLDTQLSILDDLNQAIITWTIPASTQHYSGHYMYDEFIMPNRVDNHGGQDAGDNEDEGEEDDLR